MMRLVLLMKEMEANRCAEAIISSLLISYINSSSQFREERNPLLSYTIAVPVELVIFSLHSCIKAERVLQMFDLVAITLI
jgi:hypothetical protein